MNTNSILKNLSVDCVVFGFQNPDLEVLLIKLDVDPERGSWALPGGNILMDEGLNNAAARVLEELTGVNEIYMEQVAAFGAVSRFPLHRVVTFTYYALINPELYMLKAGIKASDVKWFKISEVPSMPFDHNQILAAALNRLKARVRYRPIGFELLPKKFTLTHIQNLYQSILGHDLDKRNFRRKIMKMNLISKLDEQQRGVAHRLPQLYSFDKRTYVKLRKNGFNFDL
ncbi:MAG: NUDIX hydrolase [Calditrichaeota bacterium]|nr:NUDIX hydrolase [Calditrichota bacterium]